MMGHRQVEQAALFYEFSLEKHVPPDHLLRSVDRFVELDEVRRDLAGFYSHLGRPSIDPELMIRMLIVGYCFGIRSERRLCEEVHLNLAYRWFCRLGLDGQVPDHSTFSKNRHGRFRESDLFRRVFETVLRRCIRERLVGGEGFAVDASLIKADANRQKGVEGDKGLPPGATSRAIDEYLAVLDDAAFGAATEVTPKFVSPADPAARWTGAHGGQAFFAYSTNYLIDVEHAVIVDVEATTTEVLRDGDLTLNEKRAILASWASDACAVEAAPELRQRANGPPVSFNDIMEALRALDGEACARTDYGKLVNRVRRIRNLYDRGDGGGGIFVC